MSLTRVQVTPKAQDSSGTLVMVFSTPPTVGNAIVVPVIGWSDLFGSCSDNYGNTYALAAQSVGRRAAQFVCSKITATGASFTVTLSGHGSDAIGVGIEVTGFTTTLVVDQIATNAATSSTPNSGLTPPLVSNDVFVVGIYGGSSTFSSIVVEGVTPAWTQEFESLTTSFVPGEGDSRSLTGMTGATTSISWTPTPLRTGDMWQALLVAYKMDAPAVPDRSVTTATIISTSVTNGPRVGDVLDGILFVGGATIASQLVVNQPRVIASPTKNITTGFRFSTVALHRPTVKREVVVTPGAPPPPEPEPEPLARLYNLTGKVLVGGGAIICVVGPPNRSVKWSLEGEGTLTPFTTFTDPFGRCSCRYDAGSVVETAIIGVSFVP